MVERRATVGPEAGIHARPASRFVKTAKQFSSEIFVIKGEREVNAKSILKLTGLAKKGETITIRAEGDDEQEAVEALVELISADEH